MKTFINRLAILVLFATLACDESVVDKANRDEIIYKQTVTINDIPKATLTFFEVEDSRCPVKVQCIWAGNATVDLELNGIDTQGRVSKHIAMCLGDCRLAGRKPRYVEIDTLNTTFANQDYRFILQKVTPYPKADSSKTKAEYAIELKIETLE